MLNFFLTKWVAPCNNLRQLRDKNMTAENKHLMTLTQYAKHRGCAKGSVGDAIKSGRIKDAVEGTGRQRRILWKLADELWLKNTKINNKNSETISPEDKEAQSITKTYNASRAAKEAMAAKLAEIKYKKEAGELVDREEMSKAAGDLARNLRDQILNLPDKLAPILAAETELDVVHKILEDELHICLNSIVEEGLNGLS
jgi:hypothetical protein